MEIVELRENVVDWLFPFAETFGRNSRDRASLREWGGESDVAFGAIDEGQLVGAVWCRSHNRIPERRELFIGVRPEFRKRGLGTQLLDRLIRYAKADPEIDKLTALVVYGPSRAASEGLLRHAGFTQMEGVRNERELDVTSPE